MITEDYVSFETAKLLKEKGFNEGCYFVVNAISKGMVPVSWPTTNSDIEDEKASLIALPTLQMAMKWLREVHNISIEPLVDFGSGEGYWWTADVGYIKKDGLIDELCGYNSYEEACEAAIKYCLENLI